ncbi:MAG: mechanosensitive ion channel family protein [Desulfobacteraceae bacterium]|nr:mechanosensitive ion channel family protein [Desulfobacteraceae bacterium]
MGKWVSGEAFFGITWIKLLFCLFLLFIVVIAERIFNRIITRKIESIPTTEGVISWLRILLNALLKPLSLFIWVYGIYAALSPLYVHFQMASGENFIHFIAQKVADIGGTVALFWFLYELVSVLDARLVRWASGTESNVDNMLAPLVGKTLRVFIIVIGAMMVLQNLTGVKLGPLVASLGIGGLAVALAAKDSIANFFGTLTILFDKPFQVGERVVIDTYDGTVEKVGFRSTRIRLLTGHLVSIPNEKIVNSGVENIGKRANIRWLTNIGITYDTPPDKVEKAVHIISEILENHEGIHPDFPPRVQFNGFNDWSLNIMVVVWYHPPDYWMMQAWLQSTLLEIMRRFASEGIEFAFPSRTLYLAGDPNREVKVSVSTTPAEISGE